MNMTASFTNGSQPDSWQRLSVQQFFSTLNWDDHPPIVQLKQMALQHIDLAGSPPDLTRSVRDFFAAIDWDDSTIAARPEALPPATSIDAFTLDEFSNLF